MKGRFELLSPIAVAVTAKGQDPAQTKESQVFKLRFTVWEGRNFHNLALGSVALGGMRAFCMETQVGVTLHYWPYNLGGSNAEDYSIWGSMSRSPCLSKTHEITIQSPCNSLWRPVKYPYVNLCFNMSGCQNYGPSLGTLNVRCRITIGIQKGTIILKLPIYKLKPTP